MDEDSWHCKGGSDQEHPLKKEFQKGKVVVWRDFINSWGKKRSESKGKREKYTKLNADFQRIVRRYKEDFFNEQCKEIEENKRMWKSRDLFKKTGDIKGIFHARIGTIKDKNGKEEVTEVEEIKKRWQEYIDKLYKKDLNDPDNHNGVITHLEPDILSLRKHDHEQS